ncbi:Uncharacterized protein involved in exopolysaccharide biosynthesis [Paracoccus laeviglucosivorans]|uniref:Uncharacterized protein involved in exopolysaccharide biosynthesis n=2 Tax=Paracoccus laeviglucosivorans TaxID=1197861 RepID=A0A521DDP0_9RHOB|nr:Uncharacterized protein involved in exopolysaccharide biosynthesis [Paracoccus laeviglucosivorans]
MIRRRLPLMLTIIVCGILASFYLIISSPRVYESSAVIQVDTPAAIDQGSDSSLPASRRVQLIEQRLTARSNILDVIDRLHLFADAPGLSETDKIGAVRSSIRIESIQAPGVSADSSMSLAAIVISAQAETPDTAAAIANDFANSVVNRDRENRAARIVEARDFLISEESRLTESLAELDRKMADFNARFEDALPAAQEYLQTELTQLGSSVNALERDIMALQRDRLALEEGPIGADARPSATLVQQIRTAEIELAQARRTLAPGHPEIKRLEDNLTRLNSGDESTSDLTVRQAALIDRQLDQLADQRRELRGRIQEIERGRSRAPQVARDMETMTRQQRRLQDRYAEISRQLAQVETQQLLMDNDQAERFVMLERALPPEYPAFSNRKKSAVMGAVGSFGLAFAVALALEFLRPVLRRTEQFNRATGTRPVISLPYLPTSRDIRNRRISMVYMIVLLAAGLFVAMWLLGNIPGLQSPAIAPTATEGLA